MSTSARPGRPRRYDIRPQEGFAHEGTAYVVAMLDELSERLFDLIADLPQEALDFVPQGAGNSIAMLVVHMAWAEALWITRITEASIPAELESALLPGKQDSSGDLLPFSTDGDALRAYCRTVRQEITKPALADLEDVDTEIDGGSRPLTARGVLMHLVWHWTYHSGQVGLLRRQWGELRYQWTFAQNVGAPR